MLRRIVGLLAPLACLVGLAAPLCTNDVLRLDNADYSRAVRSGFWSVYTESQSVTLPQLVRLMQDNPQASQHPMDYLTQAEDPWAVRHYHVPLSFYHGSVLSSMRAPNRAYRIGSLIVALITCAVLYFLILRLVGPVASAIVALVATNPCFIAAATDYSPHIWFILCAATFLFLFARFLESENTVDLFASCIAFALATSALELSPGLLPAAFCALLLSKPSWLKMAFRTRGWLKVAGQTVLVYVASCFLLWPGGFLRGGYVKSYGVFVTLALFKRSGMYGPSTPASVYARLFGSNPALLLLVVVGLCAGCVLLWRGRMPKSLSVVIVYSLLAFGLNLGTAFLNKTYAAETITFLSLSATLALWYWAVTAKRQRRALCIAVGCLFCVAIGWQIVGAVSLWDPAMEILNGTPKPRSTEVLTTAVKMASRVISADSTVLVNHEREMYALYLPQCHFDVTLAEKTVIPRSMERAAAIDFAIMDLDVVSRNEREQIRSRCTVLASAAGAGSDTIDVLLCRPGWLAGLGSRQQY
jgi:hypothetical protein